MRTECNSTHRRKATRGIDLVTLLDDDHDMVKLPWQPEPQLIPRRVDHGSADLALRRIR